jgi:hypothetical protein
MSHPRASDQPSGQASQAIGQREDSVQLLREPWSVNSCRAKLDGIDGMAVLAGLPISLPYAVRLGDAAQGRAERC